METTIVLAHPYHGSFNKAIFDVVLAKEKKTSANINIIDLNKENFNPVLTEKDLSTYYKGVVNDPLVKKYNEILDRTNKIILIFPIWWYDMPAILKGFFDKTMLKDSAFTEDERGLTAIRNIEQTIVLTTSGAMSDELVNEFGDPINGPLITATFPRIGFNNPTWYNVENIINRKRDDLAKELIYIESII